MPVLFDVLAGVSFCRLDYTAPLLRTFIALSIGGGKAGDFSPLRTPLSQQKSSSLEDFLLDKEEFSLKITASQYGYDSRQKP